MQANSLSPIRQQTIASCGASSCGLHGHDHAKAWDHLFQVQT
ncbi:hypothetical protein [Pasteurella canis]|nr:hypothetical protein [Pasteurella canis]